MASGVAEGVKATCRPRPTAWRINSSRSARFSGSPPVSTTVGGRGNVAAWSSRALAGAVESSSGCGMFLGRGPAMLADQVAGLRSLRSRTSAGCGRSPRRYREIGSFCGSAVAAAAAARALRVRSIARRSGKISPVRKITAPAIGRMPVTIATAPRQTISTLARGPASQPRRPRPAARRAAEITTMAARATAR